MIADEIKHWGIFGQKWGIRRFQNKDGSLTPEGRQRYGVGPSRDPQGIGSAMSDDELRSMSKRYRQQADFYESRNRYIKAQKEYAELTKKPPSFISKFTNKIFLTPLSNVVQDSAEFGMRAASASLVENVSGKYADIYVDYIFKKNKGGQNNPNGGGKGGGKNNP